MGLYYKNKQIIMNFKIFKGLFHKESEVIDTLMFEATAKLADGKSIRVDGTDIAKGATVYLIADDGTEMLLAKGEWPLDNGMTILTDENGVIIDVYETKEEEVEIEVEAETIAETELAETTDAIEPETNTNPETATEIVDTIKKINDLETKLQELYSKFDELMGSLNEMSKKNEELVEKNKEFEAKFSKKSAEPVMKNDFEKPTNRFSSPYLGSYEEYKNKH